jgi:hypothetical protein
MSGHSSLLFATICCLAFSLDSVQVLSVQDPASAPHPDQSFYLGNLAKYPEKLSGLWEAPDGNGGTVGVHLSLVTTAPADATTLVGTAQRWSYLEVGIYQRARAVLQIGEENTFSDSVRGGGVRYRSGRLTLHNGSFDLDLRRLPGDIWFGRFHRAGLDSQVKLRRPEVQSKSPGTWSIGTWREWNGPAITCLHIVETSPGELAGWSDSLIAWGSARFAPRTTRPQPAFEHYGDLVKVNAGESGAVLVELAAYNPICCSHSFIGLPANQGQAMHAYWPAGPNQSPHASEWKRMHGNTCIASDQ